LPALQKARPDAPYNCTAITKHRKTQRLGKLSNINGLRGSQRSGRSRRGLLKWWISTTAVHLNRLATRAP